MNLQALYDLKERLEYAAIAGTGLMQEDFRLRRAVDALAPLAAVSPVFGKISAAAKSLLEAPQEERSTRLLDVLSLVDAVVYTQGVTNIPGELESIVPGNGKYVQASYGELQPLLTALGGSGSGRTSLIQESWKEHPDYFCDYRVLPHVVKALGDNYGELAEFVSMILMKQGASIIPLLKQGFDPAGKTEMVRRVRLIAKLSGEAENHWFVNILPDSKKDVREAVIQSLSLCQDNAQLLLELCQSERGKLKEAALRSLAMMEDDDCIAFWRKEAQKKPGSVDCLKGVTSTLAADFSADALQGMLSKLLEENETYDQADLDSLVKLTGICCGKYSTRMAVLWYWIADRMDQFAAIVPEKNVRNCDLSVAEHLQKTWMQTILWNASPEVLALAKALGAAYRAWFLCGAFLADMALLPAAKLYDEYAPFVVRTGLLKRESQTEQNDRIQIMRGLSAVRWSADLHSYYAAFPRWDALTGTSVSSVRKLDGVDPRWMKLLTDSKVNQDVAVYNLSLEDHHWKGKLAMDWLISRLIDGDNAEVCEMAGAWLYKWMMDTGDLSYHFLDLLRCGWKNWKGVLANCFHKRGELSFTATMSYIRLMPISNAEKAEELKQLDRIAQSKSLKVQHNLWPHEAILRDIAVLESDPNAQI